MIQKNELVSVVIPCYNQSQYLEEAVQSAVNQTYLNIEIIIVNDGSTDNTQEVAEELQKKYPDIIRVIKQKNQGLSQTRNNGISEALGEYILALDADDILDKKLVSHCMDTLIKNNVDIVYFDLQCFGAKDYIAYRKPFSENNILYENLPPAASLYKKKVWEKINGYKSNMDIGYEDWEFWINAYKYKFTFHYLPETLFYYRVKKESRDTNAVTKHTYLCSKIMMNHPDLYTTNQVQEAINTIKETEKLADLYFYYDKNMPDDEQMWITEVGHYIDSNQLEKEQIIKIHNKKLGLCTLDSLKNDMSIQKLYIKMDVDFILFYASLRFELETLKISNFAWKKNENIIKAHGTLFPFIPQPKRESPKKQLIAYKRLLRYQTKKQQHILENNLKMLKNKETLIQEKDKEIEGKINLIQKLYEEINKNTNQTETILNDIQKITKFSILKNPIKKYKAYKKVLTTYDTIKR